MIMQKSKTLAINGGKASRTRKNPPAFPGGLALDGLEEQAVLEVLRSKKLFRYYGPYPAPSRVEEFEKAFASATATQYALGLNSCTNALMIALLAAGVQPGDEVIVPAYTFVASAAAVVAANAIPVIAEIDESFTLDPQSLEKNITPKTKAVIPVHMRGVPCDMDAILALARKHRLKVIEDAAQANGGSYHGRPLGSLGDAGCFSFQYHKIITAGEGGAITTNDKNLLNRAQSLHDTGASWRFFSEGPEEKGPYTYFPGFNCRMNEITGAILQVQLKKRDKLIAVMRGHAARIQETLRNIPQIKLRRLHDPAGDVGVCVMFLVESKAQAMAAARAIQAEGIDAGTLGNKHVPDWHIYSHWDHILNKRGNNDSGFPFTLTQRTYSKDMCPLSLQRLESMIHVELSPWLTKPDVEEICDGLEKVLTQIL